MPILSQVVRCASCVMRVHAKKGHKVTKFGETDEGIKSTVDLITSIQKSAEEQTETCFRSVSACCSFLEKIPKVMREHLARFEGLKSGIANRHFVPKKDLNERVMRADQMQLVYVESMTAVKCFRMKYQRVPLMSKMLELNVLSVHEV
ncbi:unnamed protein product [Gongylonema pulchrum]|uniref:BAR domain-containing protein n=1 Tax=Gongylonema pulchrum TaxID=637853 RepID=A0A183E129_9BILA|nr:unnamed protein product [Gongylonema pulchrum]